MHARDHSVEQIFLHAQLRRPVLGHRHGVGVGEAVFGVDGVPHVVGLGAAVAGEPLGVLHQVDKHTVVVVVDVAVVQVLTGVRAVVGGTVDLAEFQRLVLRRHVGPVELGENFHGAVFGDAKVLGVPKTALLVEVEFEVAEIRHSGETHHVRTHCLVEGADVGKRGIT